MPPAISRHSVWLRRYRNAAKRVAPNKTMIPTMAVTYGSGACDGMDLFNRCPATAALANSSTTVNGTDGYTMLVGYDVTINGTAQVNADFSTLSGANNPFQNVVFAE